MGQTGILTMGIVATLVNMYGSVKRDKPIEVPVFGGFVVVAILLGVGQAAPTIAKLFALAYLITSLSENGTDLLQGIITLSGNAPGPAANPQSSRGGSPDIQRTV